MTPKRAVLHCKICDAEVCGECGFHVASPKCVCRPLGTDHATGRVTPEREPLSTAVIACIEKLAKRDLSDSNASYRAGYRDACRHVIEESGLLTVLAAAAEPQVEQK